MTRIKNTFESFQSTIKEKFCISKQQIIILWQNKSILSKPILYFFITAVSLTILYISFNLFQKYEHSFHLKNNEYHKIQKTSADFLSTDPSLINLRNFFHKKQFYRPIKNAEGQKVIEQIKRQLRFNKFQIKLENDQLINKQERIYSKKISFHVTAETDRKIYQLIDRIYHQMPGAIKFEKFDIQKNAAQYKKHPTFTGKIECLWIRQKAF